MSRVPHLKASLFLGTGLRRRDNESAGKKKTTRIGRPNTTSSPCWCQCALCAIQAKQFPEVRNRYLALKKRRGH